MKGAAQGMRKLRLIFVGIMSVFALGMSFAITGCKTIPADTNTQVFISNYGEVSEVHQDANYLEGYSGNYKVAGYVDDGEWVELSRRLRRDGSLDAAEVGQVADLGTTALGLSQGFVEAGAFAKAPVLLVPAKYVMNEWAEEHPECEHIKPIISGFGWGAAASNASVIAGAGLGAGIGVGVLAGVAAYNWLPGNKNCEGWLGTKVVFSHYEQAVNVQEHEF